MYVVGSDPVTGVTVMFPEATIVPIPTGKSPSDSTDGDLSTTSWNKRRARAPIIEMILAPVVVTTSEDVEVASGWGRSDWYRFRESGSGGRTAEYRNAVFKTGKKITALRRTQFLVNE